MKLPTKLLMAGSLALAGTAGVLGATAFGSSSQEPTSTTTINVATGPQGATGPPGPAGAADCGTGFHTGIVVFIQQGAGPTRIKTCVEN